MFLYVCVNEKVVHVNKLCLIFYLICFINTGVTKGLKQFNYVE